MQDHTEIRDLLTLAAAGVLTAEEQTQVEEHLRQCAECGMEFALWGRLTGALEKMPTPQAPGGLVARTRLAMERKAVMIAERRQQRWLFVWLTVFAWATTLLTWPLFEFFGSRIREFGDLSWTHVTAGEAWVGYMFVVGTVGALAVGVLGKRRMQETTI